MSIRFKTSNGQVIDAPAKRSDTPEVRRELMKASKLVYNLFADKRGK